MKTIARIYVVVLITILPILFVSCEDGFMGGIVGHGDVVQANLYLDDFDGFVSTIAADIYLRQGEEMEVVMEAQRNIIDNLDLDRVKNGIWEIKYDHSVRQAKPVKIFITMPYLTKAGLSGSGEIIGESPFTGCDELELVISGSGKMNVEAECKNIFVNISGSGDMYLTGSTNNLDCAITGSGGIHAYEMVSQSAEVRVSGSGNGMLRVDDELIVSISGSGSVYYKGYPTIDAHISGSGKVKNDN